MPLTIAAVGLLAFNIIMTSSINLTASENNLGGTFTEKEQDHASLEHVNYWAVLAAPPDDGSGFISNVKHLRSLLVSTGWAEECVKSFLYENATVENVFTAIDWIAEHDKPSDTVLIFLNGHGGKNSIKLYESSMRYSELDNHLDGLDSPAVGIIIDGCYSGSAIPYLQQDGRFLITSCQANEVSGCFSKVFITGLTGLADKKGIGDNNGVVSMEEAFEYCLQEYEWSFYQPQKQDNYTGQLNLTFLKTNYDQIDQFLNSTLESGCLLSIGGSYNGACFQQASQSFKPSVDILTKVRLFIYAFPNTIYPLTVSIRKNLTGEDLTSISVPASQLLEYRGYHAFDFPDVAVNPGETYYIVCRTSSNAQYSQYLWIGKKVDCYSEGNCFQSMDDGRTWFNPEDVSDLLFISYGVNYS